MKAPRKIEATHPTPQNCRQMIPLRFRSDSWTLTPEPHAIRIESNFSSAHDSDYDNPSLGKPFTECAMILRR
jgi:hypothetical protein